MILNFRSKALKRFFERGDESQIKADHRQRVRTIIALLNIATTPEALNKPGLQLHPLKGNYKGFWAVTVRANWRVIFCFEGEHAADVDYLDYH